MFRIKIADLEELVRQYQEHDNCTFPEDVKIQKLYDIISEEAKQSLVIQYRAKGENTTYDPLLWQITTSVWYGTKGATQRI